MDLALNLVGYDEEVQPAMEWIFGNTLICEDAATAKRVTFDHRIRMKSVTYDGDVYDPFGTLSGGSKPHSSGVLIQVQELNRVRSEIKEQRCQFESLDRELASAQNTIAEYRKYKQQLDLQTHEISLLEQRLSKSPHAQVREKVLAKCM